MSAPDAIDAALAWDGVDLLGPVWRELARRLGASDRPVRRITVAGLDLQGRRKLASLLRLQRVPEDLPVLVDVTKIQSALGFNEEIELRRFVERLHGPIQNRSAERAATSEARASLWSAAQERIGARVPLTLARIRAAGVPGGNVAAHEQVLKRLATTLALMPSTPAVSLPMLAWQVAGDPHALDGETLCGRYLQLAALELSGISFGEDSESIRVRRALLHSGVLVDRISTTIITLGVRATADSPLGRILEAAAELRSPVNISGLMLDGHAATFSRRSWLCVENPSVVEAAVLEGYSGPLVCTAGWPSTDAQRLLASARSQGIDLFYAGDYDSAGLIIANYMMQRFEAKILMTESRYLGADLERAPAWQKDEAIPPTPWDSALASAIRDKRRIVYQEDPAIWKELLSGSKLPPDATRPEVS